MTLPNAYIQGVNISVHNCLGIQNYFVKVQCIYISLLVLIKPDLITVIIDNFLKSLLNLLAQHFKTRLV